MTTSHAFLATLLALCVSCSRPPERVDEAPPEQAQKAAGEQAQEQPKKPLPVPRPDPLAKVELDLDKLDTAGLRGPANGKVAVSYEFCIPNTDACKVEVKAIDSTVQFMPGSRGRIGATKEQCLCIGSTHQKDFRSVLRSLAELSYVERIIECHFE